MSNYGRSGGGGSGFWAALSGLLVGAGGLYAYTAFNSDDALQIDVGHLEDYLYYLEDIGEIEPPEPFKAQPLQVSADAEIKAAPDIAVITASLTAKDTLESRAVDDISVRVNKVQDAIARFNVDVSVTNANTRREYDELCRSENREAVRRHSQINSDYWFNKRLDDRGDTDTKRRDPKPRIAQKTCNATAIKARTDLVLRVSPPEAAGDVLQALADAGADNTRLYGYDFSDYDALYQEAASKAVTKARIKAETIARHSQAELGEIVEFYVGRPARTGRFGPQPTIINKSSARNIARSSRFSHRSGFVPPPPPPPPSPTIAYDYADEVAVTGTRLNTVRRLNNGSVVNSLSADEIGNLPALSIAESLETISSVNKRSKFKKSHNQQTQNIVDQAGREGSVPTSSNNALQMSLLSGPKAIRVSAVLSYDYKTVIDGTVVPPEEDR